MQMLEPDEGLFELVPTYVFVVEYQENIPAEVDSLWMEEAEAQKRRDELGGDWRVQRWNLRAKWRSEWQT